LPGGEGRRQTLGQNFEKGHDDLSHLLCRKGKRGAKNAEEEWGVRKIRTPEAGWRNQFESVLEIYMFKGGERISERGKEKELPGKEAPSLLE